MQTSKQSSLWPEWKKTLKDRNRRFELASREEKIEMCQRILDDYPKDCGERRKVEEWIRETL
jgi:putative component of toxin-antitoxin plasmid stabilization module